MASEELEFEIEEVADNVRILIREELEAQHGLEGYPTSLDDCAVCRARRPPR